MRVTQDVPRINKEEEMKMKKNLYAITVLAVLVGLALIGVQGAQADVTVKYKMASDRGIFYQVLRYADKQHVRQDMYDGNKLMSTMLKLGDKVYMISDGLAIEISSALGSMGSSMLKSMMGDNKPQAVRFEPTGRSENIAGIRGEVYRVIINGEPHEVVLGRNRSLFEAVQGSVELAKGMMGKSAANRLMKQIDRDSSRKGMAMLRFDHSMEVVSVKSGRIPDAVFALPGNGAGASR